MYRTQFGVKAINYIGEKFKKILNSLKYVIIFVGFVLMGAMLWMLWQSLMIYIKYPFITKIVKAPPIAPLIPYFPKLFGMESFFPPFYFTYFLLALAVVAISHEFSHGIFMKLFKVKIKSTGLVFLGPILGAFVEEEKKNFEKKKNVEQMTILGAGVFANVLMALLFYGLYVLFFFACFSPSGYLFNTYGSVNAISPDNILNISSQGNLTQITTLDNVTYYLDEGLTEQLNLSGIDYLVAYEESPALLAQMKGAIVEIDGVKIDNQDTLREFMESKNPGDKVNIVTEDIESDSTMNYEITLGEYPSNKSKAYLGVGSFPKGSSGLIQKILLSAMSFKDLSVYYKPKISADFVYFIFHLLWWIMIINLLVAIFNMLPLGILDGGRFFYLGVLSLTKSEKISKFFSKAMFYLIVSFFVLLMAFWYIGTF